MVQEERARKRGGMRTNLLGGESSQEGDGEAPVRET